MACRPTWWHRVCCAFTQRVNPRSRRDLLTALKRLTLPEDIATARPKRLRFLLFNTLGKVVHHARRTLLRLTGAVQLALMRGVRQRIAALAPA